MGARDLRNSTFVYGRLAVGDRHVIEVVGTNPAMVATDHKVCPGKKFHPAGDRSWKDAPAPVAFESKWGAPYGDKAFVLKAGNKISLAATGTVMAVAYVDEENGGVFTVAVDGEKKLEQPANVPYESADGAKHFLENRKAVSGLEPGEHRVEIAVASGEVRILGLYAYDAR